MFPSLYAIVDATPADTSANTLAFAKSLLQGGVRLIQLRAKNLSSRQIYELAQVFTEMIRSRGSRKSRAPARDFYHQ